MDRTSTMQEWPHQMEWAPSEAQRLALASGPAIRLRWRSSLDEPPPGRGVRGSLGLQRPGRPVLVLERRRIGSGLDAVGEEGRGVICDPQAVGGSRKEADEPSLGVGEEVASHRLVVEQPEGGEGLQVSVADMVERCVRADPLLARLAAGVGVESRAGERLPVDLHAVEEPMDRHRAMMPRRGR